MLALTVFAAIGGSSPAQAATAEEAVGSLPGFSLLQSSVQRVDDNHYTVSLPGQTLAAGLFRADASSPWRGWISLTGANGLALDQHTDLATLMIGAAFVVVAADTGSLALADLPADRQEALRPFFEGNSSVEVASGVNLFIAAEVNGGVAKQLIDRAGAPRSVRIRGTVGDGLLAKVFGVASTAPDATLGKVSIVFDKFKPAPFNQSLPSTITTSFGVEMERTEVWGEKTNAGFTLGGSFRAAVKAYGTSATVFGQLAVTSSAIGKTIQVSGRVDLPSPATEVTDYLPGLKLTRLGVSASYTNSAMPGTSQQVAIEVGLRLPGQAPTAPDVAGVLLMHNSSVPPATSGVVAFASVDGLDVMRMIGATGTSLQLDRTVIMVSSFVGGLGPAKLLPGPVWDMLRDAGVAEFSLVSVAQGVKVVSKVTVGSGAGPLGDVGGILSGTYVIEGSATRRNGKAELELKVLLPMPPSLGKPVSDYVAPVSVALFVKLGSAGLEAGVEGMLSLKLPKKPGTADPVVQGKLAVKLGTGGAAVQVSTSLVTDWVDCFGLKDITLKGGTGVAFAADASGSLSVLATGTASIGKTTLGVGGGVSVLFSSGIPAVKGLALRLEASELDLLTPVRLGQTAVRAINADMLPSGSSLRTKLAAAQEFDFVRTAATLIPTAEPLASMTKFKVKGVNGQNAMLYIVTPGMESLATDLPAFSDAGVKVVGSLHFGDKQLAAVDASVTVGMGVKIYATSSIPIPVHPLVQIKNPTVDIAINPSDLAAAKFAISGTASLFGLAETSLAVKVTSTSFEGKMGLTIGGLESASVSVAAEVGSAAADLRLTVVVDPAKAIAGLKNVTMRMLGTDDDAAQRKRDAAAAVAAAQKALEDALKLAKDQKQAAANKITQAAAERDALTDRKAGLLDRKNSTKTDRDAAAARWNLKLAFELTAKLAAIEIEELALDGLIATANAAVSAATTTTHWAPVRLHPAVVAAQGALDAARIGAEVVAAGDAARQQAVNIVNTLSAAATSAVVLQSFKLERASLKAAVEGVEQTFTVELRINGRDVTMRPQYKLSLPASVTLDPVGDGLAKEAGGVPTQAQINARIAKLDLGYGDVRYYKDLNRNGTPNWIAGRRVGAPGWGEFAVAFGGSGGTVYGITFDRDIVKMTDKSREGVANWDGPTRVGQSTNKKWSEEYRNVVLGGGWNGYTGLAFRDNFRIFDKDFSQVYNDSEFLGHTVSPPVFTRVFGGHDFVYYLMTDTGELWCYRAPRKLGPSGSLIPVEPGHDGGLRYWRRIGTGWNGVRNAFGGQDGIIYFINESGRLFFIRHTGRDQCTASWGPQAQIGSGWDQFQDVVGGEDGVIYAVPRQEVPVVPGATVSLYSPANQRFLGANGPANDTDGSDRVPFGRLLPPTLTSARWHVVDGGIFMGKPTVALWNPQFKRFMRMNSSGQIDLSSVVETPSTLDPAWAWERFTIETAREPSNPAPRGTIRLYSPAHQRYVLLNGTDSVSGEAPPPTAMTNGYTKHVFEVIPVR